MIGRTLVPTKDGRHVNVGASCAATGYRITEHTGRTYFTTDEVVEALAIQGVALTKQQVANSLRRRPGIVNRGRGRWSFGTRKDWSEAPDGTDH